MGFLRIESICPNCLTVFSNEDDCVIPGDACPDCISLHQGIDEGSHILESFDPDDLGITEFAWTQLQVAQQSEPKPRGKVCPR